MRTNLTGLAPDRGHGPYRHFNGFWAAECGGFGRVSASDNAVASEKQRSVQDSVSQKEFFCQGPGGGLASIPYTPTSPKEAAAIANGDALFKNNCAQCHAINEKVVGPALANITKRRAISWLVPWVQNSTKVVASGDEYAVKLFNDNGQQQMPSFALSKKEIEDIVTWIEAQQGGLAVASAPSVTVSCR